MAPEYQFPNRTNVPYGPGFPALDSTQAPVVARFSGGVIDQPAGTVAGLASATITIGGTTGVGPTVTVVVGGNSQGYTYIAGDTTATIAAGHIVTALNGNGSIAALVTASNVGAVITLTAVTAGQPGMVSLSTSTTGGATAVASFTELDFPTTVFPLSTFAFLVQYGLETFYVGVPYNVDNATKTAMRNANLIQ